MKFLRAVLPNLTIALNLAVLVLLYLDNRNPMMGFLSGAPFAVLMFLTAASAITSAVIVYSDWRKTDTRRGKQQRDERKISNNT